MVSSCSGVGEPRSSVVLDVRRVHANLSAEATDQAGADVPAIVGRINRPRSHRSDVGARPVGGAVHDRLECQRDNAPIDDEGTSYSLSLCPSGRVGEIIGDTSARSGCSYGAADQTNTPTSCISTRLTLLVGLLLQLHTHLFGNSAGAMQSRPVPAVPVALERLRVGSVPVGLLHQAAQLVVRPPQRGCSRSTCRTLADATGLAG